MSQEYSAQKAREAQKSPSAQIIGTEHSKLDPQILCLTKFRSAIKIGCQAIFNVLLTSSIFNYIYDLTNDCYLCFPQIIAFSHRAGIR